MKISHMCHVRKRRKLRPWCSLANLRYRLRKQCYVPIHLKEHSKRRVSAGRADAAGEHRPFGNRPCCTNNQSVTRSPQHSAFLHQRRRRRPSTPTAPSAVKAFVFQRSRSPVPAADLPVASRRPPSAEDQLTCTAVNPDEPLLVHKHSVEEYQQIYHEAVDDVLRCVRVKYHPPFQSDLHHTCQIVRISVYSHCIYLFFGVLCSSGMAGCLHTVYTSGVKSKRSCGRDWPAQRLQPQRTMAATCMWASHTGLEPPLPIMTLTLPWNQNLNQWPPNTRAESRSLKSDSRGSSGGRQRLLRNL
ncbi:uncharacterized protein LOC118288725 isoform X2 [Scophthalmus maximus]|uniref:uncharacterized protein LOC118288725 isoform X2 n=1 Tax=Scophthalmus maximus TaxID=52904 RepID=UPI001FA8A55E|nr:uncharacterized protein LOC118288725 isoform X2 [Scophthalmus maximus]